MDPVNWLVERNWAFAAAIGVTIWAHLGFYALILLAGLQAIPKDLYEAAEMDGTPPARVFWRLTLPLLMPNLLVVIVLALIRAVQVFDEAFVLTGGGPGTATLFLTQYIYEVGFASLLKNPGLAAAASILMGTVLVALTLIQLGIARRNEQTGEAEMNRVVAFLTRRRGDGGRGGGWHWTDIVTFGWLAAGVIVMFGPAIWLVLSSFKSPAQLAEFPPSLLPYTARAAVVEGYDKPLPLYVVTDAQGTRTLAEVRRVGTVAQMVDPANPAEVQRIPISDRRPDREVGFAWTNYTEPFLRFDFLLYLRNSVFVTAMATADHPPNQFDGGLRPVEIRFSRAQRGDAAGARHADHSADRHPRAALFDHLVARPVQLALGGDPAHGRHAHRRLPAAAIHADHPRRTAGGRADGPCVGMADLLADRAAADRAGAGGARRSSRSSGAGTISCGR